MINIALLGCGVVGSGVYRVITENQDVLKQKIGDNINIKYILDKKDFIGAPFEKLIVHDFEKIINDDEIKVVVEVMGGVDFPYSVVKRSLLSGKHVVTSNKALVAEHGAELLDIAREKQINFLFEASVGGGIPILRPLISSITADKVLEISGILNGTTNHILTLMSENGEDYNAALLDAKEKGFAEADPTADVMGHDACRKIAILSSLAYGKTVYYKNIHAEGITNITPMDMRYAEKMGCVIKLLGKSKTLGDKIFAMVAPYMLKKTHPLAMVRGVYNAIFVKGNMVGETMYYGSGAGSLPTASAVVSDVVDCIKHLNKNVLVDWENDNMPIEDINDASVYAYLRLEYKNIDELTNFVKMVFENPEIVKLSDCDNEEAVIVRGETEKSLSEKIKTLSSKGIKLHNMIRMEEM